MIPVGNAIIASTGETMGAPHPTAFDDLNLDIYRSVLSKRGFRISLLNSFMPATLKQRCCVEYEFNGIQGIAHLVSEWQDCPYDEIFIQPRFDLFHEKDTSEN